MIWPFSFSSWKRMETQGKRVDHEWMDWTVPRSPVWSSILRWRQKPEALSPPRLCSVLWVSSTDTCHGKRNKTHRNIERKRHKKRESYVIFHRRHQKMDHPLNTRLFLLSQRFSPGNFCHLQSEFTKVVVLQKCLLKPPQLTSYLFLISKKKKSPFTFQTWGWSILFSHPR